ncbi:type III-A CRISPR-associated RAMP protein Csm4 [Methanothermococcus sp.]|uniref:type III-A CRISPR-associated RAMP protein Csm4 n=1 Tax=Methanothermococcus sp. TaxID=2614238 RepID=UPI0025FA3252|nr:type III-A CRISPR-associated RAMP protein Csm4 [Methanothermococcus sp.]
MHIVRLIPDENSKYHFGEGGLTESSIIFHSNSLFSAIVNNFIKLYGEDEFNKYKEKMKELKTSSLFPAIYQFNLDNSEIETPSKEILFIPKPMLKLGFDEETTKEVEEKPKDVKKIKFISIGALKDHNKRELKKITIEKEFLISKEEIEFLISKKEKENFDYKKLENIKLFKKIIEQKVSIDRIKGTTLEDDDKGQLYSIEFIKPLRKKNKKENATKLNVVGFYFLIDFQNIDEDLKKKIKASINLIKDEGLGGKRSIGAGTFKNIIINEFKEDLTIDKTLLNEKHKTQNKEYIAEEKRITLSITIPKDENEFKCFDNYQLIKIGGYIYPSQNSMKNITKLKKSVYAIAEGSICNEEIEGDNRDLRPNGVIHEVILNGRMISIPVIFYDECNEEEGEL